MSLRHADYSVYGDKGPWLVMSHGMGMDRHMFDAQLQSFSEYRIVTWDAPGHGTAYGDQDVGIAAGGDRLLSLLDKLAIGAAHMVGQSMGGYLVQEVARRAPEKVLSFTSVGSTPFGADYYEVFDRLSLRWAGQLMQLYPRPCLIRQTGRVSAYSEQARTYAMNALAQHAKRNFVRIVSATYGELVDRSAPVLFHCPVLLTVGEHDAVGKVPQYTRRWAADLGVKVHVISEAGHMANMDNAKYFNETLRAFLRRVDESSNAGA